MKKCDLKTYVLIFLILSSIVLTGKIWFDEKLWPEGYNFFAVIEEKLSFKKDDFVSSLTKETISFPKTLVVNNFELRSLYGADSEEFSKIVPDVKELLRLALEKEDSQPSTQEAWARALKSRSLHVVYPVAYDSLLFQNILGSYSPKENSIPVREFIISSEGTTLGVLSVYIKNHSTGEIFKTEIQWDKERFENMVISYALDSIGNLSYSSELNFDKTGEDDVNQKVVIESNVLIQLNKKLNHVVYEENSLYNYGFNNDVVQSLLKTFKYNVSGAKKYVENDNSVVYVENYSTMKFHPNGLMEYKAVDASKGIDLRSGNDFYKGLLGCVDFVNTMWAEVFPSKDLNINISSDVIDNNANSFRLTMDYFADGTQVNIDIPQSQTHSPIRNAVEIEVESGKIVSYRQMMLQFEKDATTTDSLSAIDALDKLLAEKNMVGKVVDDLYPVYVSDGTPFRKSAWAVTTSDNQIAVIK